MKRRDIIRALRAMALDARVEFALVRHGAAHDIYRFGNVMIPIPRHNEVNKVTANGMLRAAGRHLEELT